MSSFGRVPLFDEEWGREIEQALHTYVGSLEISLEDNTLGIFETISGEPFCGCSTCYERETYLMLTKLVIEGYEAGKVRLEELDG